MFYLLFEIDEKDIEGPEDEIGEYETLEQVWEGMKEVHNKYYNEYSSNRYEDNDIIVLPWEQLQEFTSRTKFYKSNETCCRFTIPSTWKQSDKQTKRIAWVSIESTSTFFVTDMSLDEWDEHNGNVQQLNR